MGDVAPKPRGIGLPTLICGFPKSGTTLLQALLDGHPELLCMPNETGVLPLAGTLEVERWLERVLASSSMQRLASGMRPKVDGLEFDLERFGALARARWERAEPTPRAFLECLMGALSELTDAPPARRWIEKTPEQEHELATHAADWEGLHVVHVVRDARAVLCSFRRKRDRTDERVYVDGLARRWRAGLNAAIAHERRRPGSVSLLRYEDLVQRPRVVMERLLERLGVAWDARVEQPTVLGCPWSGNSMYGAEFSGISAAPATRWRSEIDPGEQELVEALVGAELRALGYEMSAGRPSRRTALAQVIRQRTGLRTRGRAALRALETMRARRELLTTDAFGRACLL